VRGWLNGYPNGMKQGTPSPDINVQTSVLQYLAVRSSSSSGAHQRGATAAAAPSATSPVQLESDSVGAQGDEEADEAGSVATVSAEDEDAGLYVGGTPHSQQEWKPSSSQGSQSQATTDDGASSISMRVQSSVTANTSPASSQSSVAY
jgi:hypothetical protein